MTTTLRLASITPAPTDGTPVVVPPANGVATPSVPATTPATNTATETPSGTPAKPRRLRHSYSNPDMALYVDRYLAGTVRRPVDDSPLYNFVRMREHLELGGKLVDLPSVRAALPRQPRLPSLPANGTSAAGGTDLTSGSTVTPGTTTTTGDAAVDPSRAGRGHSIGDAVVDGANWATGKILLYAGDELRKRREIGPTIKLPGGVAFAPRITFQMRFPNDEAIKNDPLRKGFTGKNPVWLTTGAMLEIGAGANGTVPVGAMFSVSGGVGFKGIIQIDQTRAFDATVSQLPGLASGVVDVPVTAANALAMKVGEELNVRGEGSVSGRVGFGGGPRAGFGAASVGADVSIGASAKMGGEFGLNVLRLGGSKVRVKITALKEYRAAVEAALSAGFKLENGTLVDMPEIGSGILAKACEIEGIQGVKTFEELVGHFLSAKASVSGSVSRDESEVDSFVLDLSSPVARKIFGKLVTLQLEDAQVASRVAGSGVSHSSLSSQQDARGVQALIDAFGARLLLHDTLQLDKEGVFTDPHGKRILLRTDAVSQSWGDLVNGTHAVKLSIVQALKDDGTYEPYIEFGFQEHDKRTYAEEMETFYRFAETLGDPQARAARLAAGMQLAKLDDVSGVYRLFTSEDDSERSGTIYFTGPAIERLGRATPEEAVDDCLRAMGKLYASFENSPLVPAQDARSGAIPTGERAKAIKMVDRYLEITNVNWFTRWWSGAEIETEKQGLIKNYKERFGRDIDDDSDIRAQATQYAAAIAKLRSAENTPDPVWRAKKLGDAVQEIGKDAGLELMPIIAAMSTTAGADATLVHQLEGKSAVSSFTSKDEGIVTDPWAAAMARLDRPDEGHRRRGTDGGLTRRSGRAGGRSATPVTPVVSVAVSTSPSTPSTTTGAALTAVEGATPQPLVLPRPGRCRVTPRYSRVC